LLIVVPYPLMFTEAAAAGLRRFVERGGHAVAEARLAWNDDRGFAAEIIPGAGLHEVFGVREQDAWMRPEVTLDVVDATHVLTAGLNGGALRGSLHANTVSLLSDEAQVLATIRGAPAVVASRFGAGRTLFIGTYLGWGNHPELHAANTTFIRQLATWAGIEKPVTTSLDGRLDPPLVARLQENADGYLLFLINHNADAQDITVSVRVRAGDYALTELVSEQQRSAAAQNGELRIETRVGGQDVNVWSLKRR
jgi:hypothetical protein